MPPAPAGRDIRTLITPEGAERFRAELKALAYGERPKVVDVVAWAAGNGDRSENGDYIYSKKRLREIDRRIRFLSRRLEDATIVDSGDQKGLDAVYFGARVTYCGEDGEERTVRLVGEGEADLARGEVSILSPIARALMRRQVGDLVAFETPRGGDTLEILAIDYR
ncbi:transcription elongation factor GreB [Inquilinus sp. CAU 1745]|uniref:transcription elongation factor GreB n=1 Tax=Inquilinus sp. CAU 1745 TaxID=3140369 RepID=UPI00325B1897